ncbi:MAG: sugar phosphate isomerase/epimerase family protein [Promethearchaeota archaeon]
MSKLDQLCIITDEISQDFEYVLDIALKYGVKAVDLRKIWKKNIAMFTDDELFKLKEALNKRDMRAIVITGPIGKSLLPSAKFSTSKRRSVIRNPTYNLNLFKRILEISDFFKTPYIRIFSFFRFGMKDKEKAWNEMISLLKPLVKEAEDKGKILLMENDFGMQVYNLKRTIKFFKEINSNSVKLILDPGNFFVEREPTTPDAYDFLYKQNLVGHMHVKDPLKRRPLLGAKFGIVGAGKIDYKALFKQAIDYGYKGYFALETHALRNKEAISRKSLENMSKWLKEL